MPPPVKFKTAGTERIHTDMNAIENGSIADETCDALCRAAREKSLELGIDISFAVPEQIAISDTDFSILLGNLLENAIEACQRMESGNKMISVIGVCNEKCMKFKIKNTFSGHIQKRGQSFYSSKRNNEPGIGIRSVQSVVEKYGGIIDISNTETFFNVAVIIPF